MTSRTRRRDWLTLWPKTNQPEAGVKVDDQEQDSDGLYPKWDGSRLAKKRRRVSPKAWAMVYQQQQVSDDAVFSPESVKAAINGNRLAGPIPKGMVNQRADGMNGLIIVGGVDPATSWSHCSSNYWLGCEDTEALRAGCV